MTNKQIAFINHYLECWNATEAARRAGYSNTGGAAGQIGHKLKNHPEVKAAIRERLNERAMTADEALDRLTKIARGEKDDVKGYNAQTALVDILKLHGSFTEQTKIDGNINIRIIRE